MCRFVHVLRRPASDDAAPYARAQHNAIRELEVHLDIMVDAAKREGRPRVAPTFRGGLWGVGRVVLSSCNLRKYDVIISNSAFGKHIQRGFRGVHHLLDNNEVKSCA